MLQQTAATHYCSTLLQLQDTPAIPTHCCNTLLQQTTAIQGAYYGVATVSRID